MSEANRAIVQRYFDDVIDGGNRTVMGELFAPGAVQHFPGRDVTFEPARGSTNAPSRAMRTTIHRWLVDGDYVMAHLTHNVTFPPNTMFQTRVGWVDVGGHSVHWDAMAVFRFEDGRIAEEWVSRDELDILTQLGAIELKQPSSA